VGLLAGGFVRHARFENLIEENGNTDEQVVELRAEVDRQRNAMVGGGAALAAVGIGGIIWGAVRLSKSRTQARAFQLGPQLVDGTTGVALSGRF